MKNKQLNYEGVSITIEEDEKSPIVNIETEDADIYVNGVLVWQKFEEEEYKYISPILRNYFHKNNPYLENDSNAKQVLVEFDVCEESVSFFVPYNSKKLIGARVTLIDSIDELESDYIRNMQDIDDATADTIMIELKSIWKELEDTVKEVNFELKYSHSMGEYFYGWWDVLFSLSNWNEDNFVKVMEVASRFNETLGKYNNEYDFA